MAKKQLDTLEGLDGFTLGADTGPLTFIPTGHPQLDYAIARGVLQDKEADEPLGQGGVPLGKLVEVYGEEGGGKSSLAYRIVGNAQRMGYNCAWIDTEHSFSKQLAEINGVDVSKLIYANLTHPDDPEKVDDAEAVIDKMIAACKSGKVQVIVLDSVAFMTPKYTMEHEADKPTVGALARALSAHLPKLGNYASKYNVLCVFINQLREKIGILWGDPETTPGGRALKHACSVRLKVSKAHGKASIIEIETDTGDKEVIGGKAYVMIKKNRFAAPVRESIEIPMYYKFYFPNFADHLFNIGRQLNVIRVNKGVYSYDPLKETGRSAFIDAMQKSDIVDNIVDEIVIKAEEKDFALPPEILTYIQNRKEKNVVVPDNEISTEEDKKSIKKKAKTKKNVDAITPNDELDL